MPRIDQIDLETTVLENLEEGDPVHSGGFHCYGFHPCFNQSARAYRSWVKVGNERTFSVARSGGTATKISVAPISIPAESTRITGNTAWLALLCVLRFLAIKSPSFWSRTTAQVAQTEYSLNRDRRRLIPPVFDVTTALRTRLGTRLATGLRKLHCSAGLSCRRQRQQPS